MALRGAVLRAFGQQAENCRRLGSPFTAHICERLAAILDNGTVLGQAVCGWEPDPVESALALRLCGALHMTVRAGRAPELARLYPPVSDTGPALDAALGAVIAGQGGEIMPLLDSAPQTNEVARSAILLGGLLTIATETGLPLALNEIGSSAGLNLHPDCYAYEFGQGRRWGPPDAPLTIPCDWRGVAPPFDTALTVVSRAGSDLAPINAASKADRERMLAYIWPDQPARLARTAAALDHAAAHPVGLERAEAADWVETRLSALPEQGICRVLMHSITWQYFPQTTRDRIIAVMAAAGAAAPRRAPLAWLRLEPDGTPGSAAILLTLWPGGETRLLGRGDYHGRFTDWSGA